MVDYKVPFVITDFASNTPAQNLGTLYWELFDQGGYVYHKLATMNVNEIAGFSQEYLSQNELSSFGFFSFGTKPIAGGSTFWEEPTDLVWEVQKIESIESFANCVRFWLRPGVLGRVSKRQLLRKWIVPITIGP